MSSQSDEQAFIALIAEYALLDYCSVAITALLSYHIVLTLGEEAGQLARPRRIAAFALYIANRYLPLMSVLYGLPFWPIPGDQTSCEASIVIGAIILYSQYLPWAAFNGLRTYAVQKNIPLATGIFIFSLAPLLINTVATHWEVIYIDPDFGCVSEQPIPSRISLCFAIMARLPLILADIAVLAITWTTQYRAHRDARVLNGLTSLSTVLLRNGVLYFLMLTSLNVLQVFLSTFSVRRPARTRASAQRQSTR
ncbi:hypothetical protein BD413DRAFT_538237 [Trametes elegans]|nr:hypothetical protein BD413DRAFT_538237 [Trametes elegans]